MRVAWAGCWKQAIMALSRQQIVFVAYDGNGNVAVLVNAADGTILANYEYGPFGEVIRSTGPMAKTNPFRFSTKYQDDESDLLYYGYRHYKPSTGSWLSRDPSEDDDLIGKNGDLNLYEFAQNAPLDHFDDFGLQTTCPIQSPLCGCDIKAPLERTLDNIHDVFWWTWDRKKAMKSCHRIINPSGGQAYNSWDIEELHIGMGPVGCDRTMTFNNACSL